MKKAFYSFMAFLILILGSCQESAYVDDIQESSSKASVLSPKVEDDVITKLQAYNDSLNNNTESVYSINRSSKSSLDVALADCIGFWNGAAVGMTVTAAGGPLVSAWGGLIGGTLFGAYNSYIASSNSIIVPADGYNQSVSAYIKMKEEIEDYQEHYPAMIALNLPAGKQDLQIAGAQHNLTLNNIKKKRFSSTSLKKAYDNGTLTKNEYLVLGHKDMRILFDNMRNNQLSSIPGEKPKTIIRLYNQAVLNSAFSYTDIESISNRYIGEVYSTEELDADQKDNIASSICVLVSSVEYWKAFDGQ